MKLAAARLTVVVEQRTLIAVRPRTAAQLPLEFRIHGLGAAGWGVGRYPVPGPDVFKERVLAEREMWDVTFLETLVRRCTRMRRDLRVDVEPVLRAPNQRLRQVARVVH